MELMEDWLLRWGSEKALIEQMKPMWSQVEGFRNVGAGHFLAVAVAMERLPLH